MKFRHLVRFTQSRYFTVDYDVYRMSTSDEAIDAYDFIK